MFGHNSVVAIFETHSGAETGVKRLAVAGFDMKKLSIVGKGYHTEEKVVGFYNVGERVDLWAKQGAYWGGLCGLFLGSAFVAAPVVGGVVVLGYLASALVSALESAVVIGGLSALGAALYSIGIPEDSVIEYETALTADRFLVMVHGDADDILRADAVLSGANLLQLDVYPPVKAGGTTGQNLSISA